MKVSKSCATIMVFNFYEIIEKNDLRFLIPDFDGIGEELDIFKELEYKEIFNTIINEYSELTNNKNVEKNFKLQLLIAKLDFKYEVCVLALDNYKEYKNIEVLSIIDEYQDLKFDYAKDLHTQIKKVILKLKSLKNRIKVHKINYTKKFEKNNEEIKFNLDREALLLETNLDLSYSINTRKTTLERWINLNELRKEKAENHG